MAFNLTLVQSESGGRMLPALAERCEALCLAEGISPEGITIMGGKPYINVTGLDCKVRRRAEQEKLTFAGIALEDLSPKEGDRREFRATLTYFDRVSFLEALKSNGAGVLSDTIASLKEAFTYSYTDIGSCSLKTAKMSTMQNADNIAMLASRRATNRAKRAATGVGLTSIDEVAGEIQGQETFRAEIRVPGRKDTPGIVDGEHTPVTELEAGGADGEGQGVKSDKHPPVATPDAAPGEPPPPAPASPRCKPSDVTGLKIHLENTAKRLGRSVDSVNAAVKAAFGDKSTVDYTVREITAAKVFLSKMEDTREGT